MADYSHNFGMITDGPIPWLSMGPIAERPTETGGRTISLNSVYISTDEASGKWKIYWFDKTIAGNDGGWNLFKGVQM